MESLLLRAWLSTLVLTLSGCSADTAPPTPAGGGVGAMSGSPAAPAGGAGAAAGGVTSGGAPGASGAGAGSLGGSSAGSAGAAMAGMGGAVSSGGASGSAGASGAGGAGSSAGGSAGAPQAGAPTEAWVGTWASAQQLTEDANEPPSPGLTNNTLRQILRVSIGGQKIRVRFSNEHGSSPVVLNEAHITLASTGSAADAAGRRQLQFGGAATVTIPAQKVVWSDPLDFALEPLRKLAVSIHFGATSSDISGHPGSRTTSYLQAGNEAALPTLSAAVSTDHWYILSGIDVMANDAAKSLVILGDSITDGRGTTTNGNDRWTDVLAERLKANAPTARIGVLNQGLGGNAILTGGLGPPAVTRFDADVLAQSGAAYLIIFEGVNDIGTDATAGSVTAAYQQFVTKARAAGLRVYGATILPFRGHSYFTEAREAVRVAVNGWIRANGNFDAVIDLEAAVRDPARPDTLLAMYDSGDHLHLNPAGYRQLASAVDLQLFQ